MGVQVNSYFKSKYTGAQIENMLDAFGNTASAYETSTAYSVGDLVLYNNALYVCTGATTGAFDPSKWQQTTLAEIFANLGATYSDPNNDGNVVVGVDSTVGEKILRSISFPSLTNRYYLPFAQYIRTEAANDPSNASFDVEIPDAEEAPMHSTVIKGKTVAVNQLVKDGNFPSMTNWNAYSSTANVSGNIATVTASAQGGGLYQLTQTVKDHIYFISVDMKTTTATNQVGISFVGMHFCEATTNWQTVAFIATATSTNNSYYFYSVRDQRTSGWDAVQAKNVIYIDLTTAFSASIVSTITDVASFKAAFLKDRGYPLPVYIPYDTGSLANVDGTYQLHGKNLYDIDSAVQGGIDANTGAELPANSRVRSDYMPVKPSTVYRYKTNNALYLVYIVYHYDANKNFIRSATQNSSNSTTTTPDNAAYTRIVLRKSDNNDFTKDAVQNMYFAEGNEDAPFEPYYNGGTIDCSGAPLNGFDDTVCDEKDYATGKRITRFPLVDLGTLNWTYDPNGGDAYFLSSAIDNFKRHPYSYANGILCGLYTVSPTTISNMPNMSMRYYSENSSYILVKNQSYSDAATFKAAMSGVMLGYEAATPIVTTETPQPVYTEYGYNCFEPVSGGVQSAEVDTTYYENIAGYIDKRLNGG